MKAKFNVIRNTQRLARYNMSIIFGGRFIYFIIAAFLFFLLFGAIVAFNQNEIGLDSVYILLSFPAFLLVFYPSVFGIQNDADQRTLEIIFGIPNYRYKVWLIRLIMIYVLVFIIIILFAALASVLLYKIDILEMAYQLMFPIVFLGSMAFMFSTLIKNGNGTAVAMVLIGVALLILKEDVLDRTQWDIFLNPFQVPGNMNEVIWTGIISKNRTFLAIGMLVFILYGLFNLQKREKFV